MTKVTGDTERTDSALLIAAQQGSADAQYQLARALIAKGKLEPALPWLRRAMTTGHVPAALELARIKLHFNQTDAEIAEAIQLLRLADAKGAPAAPYLLALIALGDHALPRDFGQINTWIRRSGQRRYPLALRALAIQLGRSPRPADMQTSNRLLDEACAMGDPVSGVLLAERARLGQGMPADPGLSEQLYSQLASAGHARAPQVPADTAPAGQVAAASTEPPDPLDFGQLMTLPPARMLNQKPRVCVYDGVLSAEDCRFIAVMAQPHLRRSQVFDPHKGDAIQVEVRTSSDASIDPILEDFTLRLLQLRMAKVAGGELIQAEPLAVLRYGVGERYLPHYDFLSDNAAGQDLDRYGQRRTTLCCYLNPVEAGGQTDFPNLAVRVEPAPGRAVVFDNVSAEGALEPDSLHAGLPVTAGEKWLATLWLRAAPFRKH